LNQRERRDGREVAVEEYREAAVAAERNGGGKKKILLLFVLCKLKSFNKN